MIDNGNNDNLISLKEAILIEADDFIKINKMNLNIVNVSQENDDNLIENSDDFTNTISKIDEFLENLDKQKSDNQNDEIEILNYNEQISTFQHNPHDGASTSTTTCSEDSSITKKSLSDDIKSLLKQKLLDGAAQRACTVGSKESKNLIE
jgi:hypothetical protein